MGRRGKAPLPTAMRKLRGTNTDWRKPKGKEPVVRGDIPKHVPASLHGQEYAIECWTQLREFLKEMKVATKVDTFALEGMCQAYHRARTADELVLAYGVLVNNMAGSLQANPAVRVSQMAWSEVRKFAQEFGFTPASRTRVREVGDQEMPNDGEKKLQDAEKFIFGAQKATGTDGRGGAAARIVGRINAR